MFNRKGRFGLATFACVGLAIAISSTVAVAWNRGAVQTFALIPGGVGNRVEGLAVGPDGKVYTATFNPNGSGPAQLFTFNPQGKLLGSVPIMVVTSTGTRPSSPAILGLEVIPQTTNKLLVLDFGNAEVLLVDPTANPATGNASQCIVLPAGNPGLPHNGLNGITFDSQGNVYFSDSLSLIHISEPTRPY